MHHSLQYNFPMHFTWWHVHDFPGAGYGDYHTITFSLMVTSLKQLDAASVDTLERWWFVVPTDYKLNKFENEYKKTLIFCILLKFHLPKTDSDMSDGAKVEVYASTNQVRDPMSKRHQRKRITSLFRKLNLVTELTSSNQKTGQVLQTNITIFNIHKCHLFNIAYELSTQTVWALTIYVFWLVTITSLMIGKCVEERMFEDIGKWDSLCWVVF
jgi:hypothetical protein